MVAKRVDRRLHQNRRKDTRPLQFCGTVTRQVTSNTTFWSSDSSEPITLHDTYLNCIFTLPKNTFCTSIEMKMLTSYKKGISLLRRWRREWWWRWWWPPPLVLDWQPWGLREVGRNGSRCMLLKVWRNLFNKTKLRLRLPARKLSIVCYNFFLLKM